MPRVPAIGFAPAANALHALAVKRPLRAPSGRPYLGWIAQFDFFGYGHTDQGPLNFFSRTTLQPRDPRVTFTASASWLTPQRMAWRDRVRRLSWFSWPWMSGRRGRRPRAG